MELGLAVAGGHHLWEHPTGYRASMVGFPYDDLERWRGPYPPDTLATAFTTVTTGLAEARHLLPDHHPEAHLLEAVEIHLASTANQIRYLLTRNPEHVEHETTYARRLLHLQWTDSRIGYEASNHYLYTPPQTSLKDPQLPPTTRQSTELIDALLISTARSAPGTMVTDVAFVHSHDSDADLVAAMTVSRSTQLAHIET